MALSEGQVQIRGLTLGPGTPYTLYRFNPFRRRVRAKQSGEREWNHGSWSGAEWAGEKPVPLRLIVSDNVTMTSWMELDQQLAAAFAPVGDTATDVEMWFVYGGREYVMFGRPRMVEPNLDHVGNGWSLTQAAFMATDPLIYSAELHTMDPITLPRFTGGLAAPLLVPFTVETVRVGGAAEIVNDGTADTGFQLRIDGPVPDPRVSLQRPDGTVQTLRWPAGLTLADNQWVDIDTEAETAFLNGLVGASVYPGFIDWPILPPGTSRLLFDAADRESGGLLDPSWRDAWY